MKLEREVKAIIPIVILEPPVDLVTICERVGKGRDAKFFFAVYDSQMNEHFRTELVGDRKFFEKYKQMIEATKRAFIELDCRGNIVNLIPMPLSRIRKAKQYNPKNYYAGESYSFG